MHMAFLGLTYPWKSLLFSIEVLSGEIFSGIAASFLNLLPIHFVRIWNESVAK